MKLTAEATVLNDAKINTDITTAQDTADTATTKANNAQTTANTASNKADAAQATANLAKNVADNTAQYFWFTSTGSDTGAHISEKTQTQFIANPSGGNLLARSTGIAVRNGLEELSTFGADGIRVGVANDKHFDITSSSLTMYDSDQTTPFVISTESSYITTTYTAYFNSSVGTYNRSYPGFIVDNLFKVGVGTTSAFPSSLTQSLTVSLGSTNSVTVNNMTIGISRLTPGDLKITVTDLSGTNRFYGIQYTTRARPGGAIVNGRSLFTQEHTGKDILQDSTGSSTTNSGSLLSYGGLAFLSFTFSNSNTVANNGIVYQGQLSRNIPAITTNLNCYSNKYVGYVSSTGLVQITNISGSSITGAYGTADGVYFMS